MSPRRLKVLASALVLAASTCPAWAQVSVTDPWIRGTVPQQKATGLFAQITAANGGRLVGASSPVAGVLEIHEMTMDGNVMKMRPLPAGLELPAGTAMALKPGGYHLMLLELKRQLKPGEVVPVTLVVEGADHQRMNIELNVPVRALAAAPAHEHEHKH